MTSFLGKVYPKIDEQWFNLRTFLFYNKSIAEFTFILIYFLVQFGLIFCTYYFPEEINLIVSVFGVVILTIFSIHKMVMESRIHILEDKVAK